MSTPKELTFQWRGLTGQPIIIYPGDSTQGTGESRPEVKFKKFERIFHFKIRAKNALGTGFFLDSNRPSSFLSQSYTCDWSTLSLYLHLVGFFHYPSILPHPQESHLCNACTCSAMFDSLRPMDCNLPGFSSMKFSRQEYWSRLPFPTPGDLPDPVIEPISWVS